MTDEQLKELNKQKEYFDHVKGYRIPKSTNQINIILEELEKYFGIEEDAGNENVPKEVLNFYAQALRFRLMQELKGFNN